MLAAFAWLGSLVNKALAPVLDFRLSFQAKWLFVLYLIISPHPSLPPSLSSVPEWEYVSVWVLDPQAPFPAAKPLTRVRLSSPAPFRRRMKHADKSYGPPSTFKHTICIARNAFKFP